MTLWFDCADWKDDGDLLDILRDRVGGGVLYIEQAESARLIDEGGQCRRVSWRVAFRMEDGGPLEVVSGTVYLPVEEEELNKICERVRGAAADLAVILRGRSK